MDQIFTGDALTILRTLPAGIVQTCVTSPPYFGLRDYGVEGQIGVERTPDEFVERIVDIFREVLRVLRDDGTLWLNLGDSYSGSGKGAYGDGIVRLSARSRKQKTSNGTHQGVFKKHKTGLKPKDMIGIPWRVAFALQAAGWYLRQDIIWHKPNPMPESVTDRCTKAHEYMFLLSKLPTYYFDSKAIREPAVTREGRPSGIVRDRVYRYDSKLSKMGRSCGGKLSPEPQSRNRRSVWTVSTKPYKGAHFATFPQSLIEPCILAGSPPSGIVLDPFLGSGTTAAVAKQLGRRYVGIELNPAYVRLAQQRLAR